MIKKYNISKPEKYVKDNVEKTYWSNVGTMTEFHKQDGSISRIIEIPAIGLKASVFEQVQKVVAPAPVKKKEDIYPIENSDSVEDDINPDDIPF